MRIRKSLEYLKSYYTKIVTFLIIPSIVVLLFTIFMEQYFFDFFEKQIINEYTKSVSGLSESIDNNILEILQTTVLFNSSQEFKEVFYSSQPPKKENQYMLSDVLNMFYQYRASQPFVDSIFIIHKSYEKIICSSGTYDYDNFFNNIYKYNNYDENFWLNLNKYNTNYEILKYDLVNEINNSSPKRIIPIVEYGIGGSTSGNILVINIKGNKIDKLLDANQPTKNSQIFILNNQGNLMAKTSNTNISSELENLLYGYKNRSNIIEDCKFNNKKYVLITTKNPNNITTDFLYVAMIPLTDIHAISNRLRFIALLILALSFLIGIILTILSAKKIYAPIKNLMMIFDKSQQSTTNSSIDEYKYLRDNILVILNNNHELSQNLTQAYPYVKEHFLLNLLKDNGHKFENDTLFITQFRSLFPHSFFMVSIIRFHFKVDFYTQYDNDEIAEIENQLSKIVQTGVPLEFPYFSVNLEKNVFSIIINTPSKSSMISIHNSLKQFGSLFQEDEDQIETHIALGNIYEGLSSIRRSYNEAMHVFSIMSVFNNNKIAIYQTENQHAAYSYSTEEENKLCNYFFNNDFKEAISLMKIIITRNMNNNISEIGMKQIYIQIYNTISKVMAAKQINEQELMQNKYIDILNEFTQISVINLGNYLTSLVDSLFLRYSKFGETIEISDIKNYIDENYTNDIYLDALAEKYKINSKYMSKFLKEALGISFKQYVTNLRIERSKELLIRTKSNIDFIAEKVGFNSRNTFIRAFKLHEGITPTDYRNSRQV